MDVNTQTCAHAAFFSDLDDLFWETATENEAICQTDPFQVATWTDTKLDTGASTPDLSVSAPELRHNTRSTPLELRLRVVQLREQQSLPFSKISSTLAMPLTTVKSIWQTYRREGRVEPLQGGGWNQRPDRMTVAARVSGPVRARILELRAAHTPLRVISDSIWHEYGIRVSRSACGVLLRRLEACK
ncbi:Hypothetical protein GLP15_139 [Giardia lamblia P15]|uniref:Uncharacterized protein n=1 Tax=Giardia intestinalis (strain P15) TaxID=658858 RepID=E1EY66_GIAIA|nr:Hypothetical protein GLP15_139 [Giardia lamblia P15]